MDYHLSWCSVCSRKCEGDPVRPASPRPPRFQLTRANPGGVVLRTRVPAQRHARGGRGEAGGVPAGAAAGAERGQRVFGVDGCPVARAGDRRPRAGGDRLGRRGLAAAAGKRRQEDSELCPVRGRGGATPAFARPDILEPSLRSGHCRGSGICRLRSGTEEGRGWRVGV
ncbi:hypothetical protein DFJ74DRAFT_675089, partial [Hyaloraphidium curvatum]